MDEMRDGFMYAWKGAMRGAKKGYKLTKNALRTIPMEKLRVPGADNVMSRMDIRRLFQMKYGAEVSNERGEKVAAVDMSEIEESDEETLTDEQVQERVDKKYFDKNYNAMKYELSNMPVTYSETDEERLKERQEIEISIKERRQMCDVVSTTLKRRILANHHMFVNGVEYIKQLNDELLQTSSDCKKGRACIRKATSKAAVGLTVLARRRQEQNLRGVTTLTNAMVSLYKKRSQLLALVDSGKVLEAAKLLREEGAIEQEEQLSKIASMQKVIAEWKDYRDNKTMLMNGVEQAITDCLTLKFIPDKYRYSFEATLSLGDINSISQLIATLLWKTAVQILIRSLIELSYEKDESAPIADIVAAISPDHLLVCVCQMCARMMDFLFLYSTVVKLHRDNSTQESVAARAHVVALQSITPVGRRIGKDICEKIRLILENAQFRKVGVEKVLHMFYVVSIFIEATSSLGLEKTEMAEIRTLVKTSLEEYMMRCHQVPRAKQILTFMTDEQWSVGDRDAGDLLVVKALSPGSYRSTIKAVKNYLSDASIESGAMENNPFYAPNMSSLPNTADQIQTETLRESLASVKPPLEITTTSSVVVANTLFEYIARVVVRFPPIASEVLGWCEDLVAMYVYVIADNFVSISRAVPLADQGDCSVSTKAMIRSMAEAAMRAAGEASVAAGGSGSGGGGGGQTPSAAAGTSLGGPAVGTSGGGLGGAIAPEVSAFPPRVWTNIRGKYTNENFQFAIVNRAVALQSCISLTQLLSAAVRAVSPLLPESVAQQRQQNCDLLRSTSVELLHICLHRLSQAVFPMESVCNDIAKVRGSDREMKASAYIAQLAKDFAAFHAKRQKFPTADLEALFKKRFVFSVQMMILREYAKLGKRKLTDTLVMQLSVDGQGFNQIVTSSIGKESLIMPDYVVAMVKAGFADDNESRTNWVRSHHEPYFSNDLLMWFAGSDRTFRQQLEAALMQLHHHDAIPMAPFLA